MLDKLQQITELFIYWPVTTIQMIILAKIENFEKMHQKIHSFFYISKKNEINYT